MFTCQQAHYEIFIEASYLAQYERSCAFDKEGWDL